MVLFAEGLGRNIEVSLCNSKMLFSFQSCLSDISPLYYRKKRVKIYLKHMLGYVIK